MMFCCERLKNISPNIFRLASLKQVDFTDCRGVITAFSDASVVATMEDHSSCIPLYENTGYGRVRTWEDKDDSNSEDSDSEDSNFIGAYFSFQNCFKLNRDARELIIRSCFKHVALPGGEVPTYFQHRKFGDSLTVALPKNSFSQKIFRFKACIVVDLLTEGKCWFSYLKVRVGFNGIEYYGELFEDAEFENAEMKSYKTDLLILCSFKFEPTDLPSKLASNDVEFEFSSLKKIKECGVQLLKIKDDSGGSSETEPPNDSDGSKKLMRMTSEEYINLPSSQIEADTGLDALNLEVSLGQGEASSVKLRTLSMNRCKKLESFPTDLKLESLEYLDLTECPNLRNFPEIKMRNSTSWPHGIKIKVGDCLWNKNLPGPDYLDCLMRCMRCEFRPDYLARLIVRGNKMLEKLWEGVQSLSSLVKMDLSKCDNLREIPDLSKATNLESLKLNRCKSLVTVPSTIGNLHKLVKLYMEDCTRLEVLPTDVNLSSLKILNLSGCSSLRMFPQISKSIETLNLDDTAIEEFPCCIENFSGLNVLTMSGCKMLKNISPNIFRLTRLGIADFSDSGGVITALNDASVVATMENHFFCIPFYENIEKRLIAGEYEDEDEDEDLDEYELFNFQNCFKLDIDARELILRSCFKLMVLPGGEVPMYFKHRAYGDSLTVILPQSFISQEILRFKVCIVVDSPTYDDDDDDNDNDDDDVTPSLLDVWISFDDVKYCYSSRVYESLSKTDHLVLSSFKFWHHYVTSKLDFKDDVKFEFSSSKRIKECGVQLLYVSPYPDDSDRSSATEYNHGEKYDARSGCG